MKRIAVLLLALLPLLSVAQVKIPKDANRFVYHQYDYGEVNDTSCIEVWLNDCVASIETPGIEGTPVQGYAPTHTYIDYPADSITVSVSYPDSSYYYRTALSRSDIEWKVEGPAKERKYTCSINSNTLVFVMDETVEQNATPLPYYGLAKGVLRSFTRNGQLRIKLAKSTWINNAPWPGIGAWGRRVTPRELDRIMKERLVVTTRIFDHEQICWGKENAHIDGGIRAIPADIVLHYAGGTLILKKVKLPRLPHHYQHFVEIHQQSNGDAYDRTASVFVIPTEKAKSFRDGLQRLEALPSFVGKDGKEYQGIKAEKDYLPPVELVRFFTSFGAGHFNDRVQIDGLEWADENYYKMEVSELRDRLRGDVLIGAFIGNYDKGGHKLSLDLLAYPGENKWSGKPLKEHSIPLFNTCNVMEMSGQNYGRLFATDSLEVEFEIPESAKNVRLRYISTGHGGWDNGDEFNPKENAIYIDGVKQFTHTPWRCDCATFRDQSPVSGNFWNGVSSSDYSRSGWCPGTATNPVYFDLSDLKPGKHTLRVAIPQSKDEGESFSHWMVSGVLLYEQ